MAVIKPNTSTPKKEIEMSNETIDNETGLAVVEAGVLAQLNRSEIEAQVSTARRYPRDLKRYKVNAIALATLDDDTADECMYALKRKDKQGKIKMIEGPSVRLAEILVSCFGNCRAGARVVDEGKRFVTAQGVFADLEINSVVTYETQRRITTKDGYRYGDDMITVTANAACSIALRNAITRGIPKPIWKPIYDAARQRAVGDAKTLNERRDKMFVHFSKMHVDESTLLEFLEVEFQKEVTLEHVRTMVGFANAIRDGEVSIDDLFGDQSVEGAGRKLSETAIDDGRKKTKGKPK